MWRVIWFFVLMGGWSAVTLVPGAVLSRRRRLGKGGEGARIASGALLVLGFIGLSLLTAILFTAWVRGTRLPWVGGKGPDL